MMLLSACGDEQRELKPIDELVDKPKTDISVAEREAIQALLAQQQRAPTEKEIAEREGKFTTHKVGGRGVGFIPNIIYIGVNDVISWEDMAGQTTTSVIVPKGAESWSSSINSDMKVKFTVPGVYLYKSEAMEMMGAFATVIVGKPSLKEIARVGKPYRDDKEGYAYLQLKKTYAHVKRLQDKVKAHQ